MSKCVEVFFWRLTTGSYPGKWLILIFLDAFLNYGVLWCIILGGGDDSWQYEIASGRSCGLQKVGVAPWAVFLRAQLAHPFQSCSSGWNVGEQILPISSALVPVITSVCTPKPLFHPVPVSHRTLPCSCGWGSAWRWKEHMLALRQSEL